MIQFSEPLAGSKEESVMHDILLDGIRIGHVSVSYIRAEEVKSLRKYTKRKLAIGQPYSVQVLIDAVKGPTDAAHLGKEGLREIVSRLKETFEGLEERDVYITELNVRGKAVIGRGSQL
jgi:hypothetical protein